MPPTTDEIMGQAQVFASAWALVGSRFDSGDEMDRANGEKACLHGMVEALTKERDNAVYACGLVVQRCDALAVDAARYRWLRSSRHNYATVMTYVDGLDEWVAWAGGEDVDFSVDKAMFEAGVQ